MAQLHTTGCSGFTELTGSEYAMLSALPLSAIEVDLAQWCGLEQGHSGCHHSLGQVAFEEEWWLRWDENGQRDLAALPGCPAKLGNVNEDLCTLPVEHVGAHNYEFRR